MSQLVPSCPRLLWSIVLIGAFGCHKSEPDAEPFDPQSATLAPVSGVITLNHKPLGGAVVVFMPKTGSTSVGETDEAGKYELQSFASKQGAPAGHYKVAVSYFVSPDGEPQGLSKRSTLTPAPAFHASTERLPKEYSDLGRTKLTADVAAQGGTFDFNIDAPDADVPSEGKAANKTVAAPQLKDDHPATKASAEDKKPPPGTK